MHFHGEMGPPRMFKEIQVDVIKLLVILSRVLSVPLLLPLVSQASHQVSQHSREENWMLPLKDRRGKE